MTDNPKDAERLSPADHTERARQPIEDVGPDFAAFLRREMSCEASGCHWQWFAEGSDNYVGCGACGSSYPWRDTHYLRRVYMAERAGAEKMRERAAQVCSNLMDAEVDRADMDDDAHYHCEAFSRAEDAIRALTARDAALTDGDTKKPARDPRTG